MTHIEQRAGTAAQWTSANPVLNINEFGWETNTGKGKIGDGVTAWNALPYFIISAPSLPVTSVAGRTGAVVLSVADVAGAAPLASPALTGAPTAPTAVGTDNTTKIATTAHVKAALAASPALGGTPTAPTQAVSANGTSIATTAFVKSQGYAPTVSPALTGTPTAPTQASTDNSTRIATTAFVKAQGAWTSYVPTLISGGSMGNATRSGAWARVGDIIFFYLTYTLGSTSTITGTPIISLPAFTVGAGLACTVELNDAGNTTYLGFGVLAGAQVSVYAFSAQYGALTAINANVPFTWTSPDSIIVRGSYRT